VDAFKPLQGIAKFKQIDDAQTCEYYLIFWFFAEKPKHAIKKSQGDIMEAVMVAMEEEEAMMEAMRDLVPEHVEQEPPQPPEQLAVQEAKNNK
jgi:hypothetical protein